MADATGLARAFDRLAGWEARACLRVNACSRWDAVRIVFATVSRLGDGVFWYVLMGTLAAVGGDRGRITAVAMAATGLVATSLYKVLKRACRRPRPMVRHDGVLVSVPPLDEFSFPSGHTLHAVSFTVVALAGVPELAWLLVPFTALVAMSRVVLGLHYVSDVLVGALIGWGLGQAGMLLLA
ncbi:MAG: phosphatase PAP2 family protein [Planctomycetota bacterium]